MQMYHFENGMLFFIQFTDPSFVGLHSKVFQKPIAILNKKALTNFLQPKILVWANATISLL